MVAHVATVAFLGLEARAVECQVQIAGNMPGARTDSHSAAAR